MNRSFSNQTKSAIDYSFTTQTHLCITIPPTLVYVVQSTGCLGEGMTIRLTSNTLTYLTECQTKARCMSDMI